MLVLYNIQCFHHTYNSLFSGDFRTLIKQQKEAEEAEEMKKSKSSKLKVKGHRRGRSDGTIFIKDKQRRTSDLFNVSNNLLRQMSTSSGSLEYKGSFSHIDAVQKEFTNMSFLTEPDERDEAQKALHVWQMYKMTLEKNCNEVKRSIEERKETLVTMVTEYANELVEKLDKKFKEQQLQADQNIKSLQMVSTGSQSALGDSSLTTVPPTPPHLKLTHQTHETLSQSVSQLFGSFQTIQTRSTVDEDRRSSGEGEKSNLFMSRPQYLGSISAKTSKDMRECGITDMAFTKDRQVIVVDKHNKLVKVLDTEGKLVRFIGKNILKEPSRVSVLPWSEQVLVTDSGAQEVKVFSTDGAVVSTVATDLSSPSGHCVIPDLRQIAVINFDTKLVTVYEEDSDSGFKKLHSFPTGLDCPAYITRTHTNNLVISDWSANKLRIYNSQGKFLKQISKAGSGQGQISKPQGVHGDSHGNLLLGEKGNRRIQIFNDEGESTFVMDKKTYELNIPMSLDTTEDGYMIIGEYQGSIKFFKYLDLPETNHMTVGQKPKGRATSVVSPEVFVTPSESVM